MVTKLSDKELHLRLTELDAELASLGFPLRFRPMRFFQAIYGAVPDGGLRHELFDPITLWFIERYGNQAKWDGIIGRIPVQLRGEVYLLQVPCVTQDTMVKLTERLENLPPEMAPTFTTEEFNELAHKIFGGTSSFFKLYTLSVDDPFIDDTERDLIWMALFDLEAAANCLKQSGDTRNSIFHSHAAAEKFLKVALKKSGNAKSLQSFGHNIPKIFGELAKAEPRYAWLKSSVDLLQTAAPNMQIRYQILPRTVPDAISAFNAALYLCGTLAEIWIFDVERGTKQTTFQAGSFYLDWAKMSFYCKEVINKSNKDLAVLILFHIDSITGQQIIMEITKELHQSALFVEVKEAAEIRVLQQRFDWQMRNKGRRVDPQEFGIRIASGPEGSYMTKSQIIEISTPDKL